MKDRGNILFSGVGGQGILLASEIAAYALMKAGLDVKKSEVHGMAQRGGSVEAHLRYGAKVYSPLIEPGSADVLCAFEMLESLRYLTYLSKQSKVIVNLQRIPPPSVATGLEGYPEGIIEKLRSMGLSVYPIDAYKAAVELNEPRAINMVIVGALSRFLPVQEDIYMDVIKDRVKKDFIAVNKEAFLKGRNLVN